MPKIICNIPTEQGVKDEIVSSELRATVDNEDEDENYDESIGTLKRPGEDKPKAVRIFDTGPSTSPQIHREVCGP